MTSPLSTVDGSRLEKAAFDNGFDRELGGEGNWLAFASSQCSLRIWLAKGLSGQFAAAFSKANVVAALSDSDEGAMVSTPSGAAGVRLAEGIPGLHRLLRRAFQLGKSLPDELLHIFNAQTASLARSTEAERLVILRVGQNIFRAGLMEYWEFRCAITGLNVPALLRASHIKPWADCETDAERLDVFNGLLLAPHLDATFDQGFVTIDEAGNLVLSERLDSEAKGILAISQIASNRVRITKKHAAYLAWHRKYVFQP